MSEIIIAAPFRGWAAPLEEVPDPVFAERMLGDGVAIHPLSGSIRAPCDGRIATLHAAHHAVTIETPEGAQILIHFGLETVALAGSGFTAHVVAGQAVKAGDLLIECDLDRVALAAPSLVSPVILANPDAFRIVRRTVGREVAEGEMLLAVASAEGEQAAAVDGAVHRREQPIALRHGIHARPAARIADALRPLDAELVVIHTARQASGRSPVGLLGLGIANGDLVTLEARGSDALAAIEAVAALITGGMDEAAPPPGAEVVASPGTVADANGALRGILASPGLALGPAARFERAQL